MSRLPYGRSKSDKLSDLTTEINRVDRPALRHQRRDLDLFAQELIDNDDGDDNISYTSTHVHTTSNPSISFSSQSATTTTITPNKRNSIGVSNSGVHSSQQVAIPTLQLHKDANSNQGTSSPPSEELKEKSSSRPNSPHDRATEKSSHKEKKEKSRPGSIDLSSAKILLTGGQDRSASKDSANANLLSPQTSSGMKKSKSSSTISEKELDKAEKKDNLMSAVRKDLEVGELMLTGALDRLKPLPGTAEEDITFMELLEKKSPGELASKKGIFDQFLKKDIDGLPREEMQKVVNSWNILSNMVSEDQRGGVSMLFDIWKEEFFTTNDTANSVLFTIGLTAQVRALTSMINVLLLFINDFDKFSAKIPEVCTTHEIMGIGFETYAHSAKVLSGGIQKLLGELGLSTFTNISTVWYRCFMHVSKILWSGQQYFKYQYFTFNCHILTKNENDHLTWKKAGIMFLLDRIYYFSDTKFRKMKQNFPLTNTDLLDLDDFDHSRKMPSKFGFSLVHTDNWCWINDLEACLCFDNEKDANDCKHLLELRINTLERSNKNKPRRQNSRVLRDRTSSNMMLL